MSDNLHSAPITASMVSVIKSGSAAVPAGVEMAIYLDDKVFSRLAAEGYSVELAGTRGPAQIMASGSQADGILRKLPGAFRKTFNEAASEAFDPQRSVKQWDCAMRSDSRWQRQTALAESLRPSDWGNKTANDPSSANRYVLKDVPGYKGARVAAFGFDA